jgi:GxxExxY protein
MTNESDPRTYAIIGAAIEVHRQLGHGFLEAVYQEALEIELRNRHVPFQREAELAVSYKGTRLECSYRADFLCFDAVVVELKTVRALGSPEEAQIINYLRATGYQIGLLLNFGTLRLEHKRFVQTSIPLICSNLRPSVGNS